MGGVASKKKSKYYGKYVRSLTEKIRLLQADINEMMCEREKEIRSYESDLVVFAFKEAEWKQERKRLKEEVKRQRKMVEEKEERIRGTEDGMVGDKSDKDWQLLGTTSLLVEQMREESVWRDEAVEKWKLLYLAIKTELDDLIQRTDRGWDLMSAFLWQDIRAGRPIQIATVTALFGLLSLDFEEVIQNNVKLPAYASQSVPTDVIRKWFSFLTKEQQALSFSLLQSTGVITT